MLNNNIAFFTARLKEKYYIQSLSARPLFLNSSAVSGFSMRQGLGYNYHHFLINYNDDYGEGCYLLRDFGRLWKILKKKMAADHDYLKKVNQQYWQTLKQYSAYYRAVDQKGLSAWTDSRLLEYFQTLVQAQIDAVGISHIIEVIGLKIEEEFRSQLLKELKGHDQANFNYLFQALLIPTKPSFVAQEEADWQSLLAKKAGPDALKKLLAGHLQKYFWLQNSYAGPQPLSLKQLEKRYRLDKREAKKSAALVDQAALKSRLIAKYAFSQPMKKIISVIDYTAAWQDERKAAIFRNIGYLGLVSEEMARRLKMKPELIYYLSDSEALDLVSLSDLKSWSSELRNRIPGVLFFMDPQGERYISGEEYRKLDPHQILVRSFGADQAGRELRGTIANAGPALVGPVRILKSLADIKKVEPGDILVASMTRPEFMPAIRKAAAIITDEGGITCHAAIIARELNIPAIIGTKIATKTLKNGCLVEVKANHGIVRILK
jgi:phosphohistidine swiveling domain-containing protein